MIREIRDVQTPVINAVRDSGGYVIDFHVGHMQKRGVPDVLACIDGRYTAIECKRPGRSYLTPVQKQNLIQIAHAGGVAMVVESIEAFHQILAVMKGELSPSTLTYYDTNEIKIYSDDQYNGIIGRPFEIERVNRL